MQHTPKKIQKFYLLGIAGRNKFSLLYPTKKCFEFSFLSVPGSLHILLQLKNLNVMQLLQFVF